MKSIIQENKECWVCGTTQDIHEHHIIYGTANRRLSEKYGLKVWLCGKHHNLSNEGVHFNRELDLRLKQLAQKRFKEEYPNEDFLKIFGRNYVTENI